MSARPGPRDALPALTSIRFVNAVWVAANHQSGPTGWLREVLLAAPFVFNFVRVAYVAVSLFFILSGFVLAYNYWDGSGRVDARVFWRARVARIYPVYLLGILACMPAMLWKMKAATSAWSAAGWLLVTGALSVMLLQAWYPRFAIVWNAPGWSMSSEALFYLGFPRALPFFGRRRPAELLAWVLALWGLALAVPAACWWLAIPGVGDVPSTMPANSIGAALVKYNPLLRLPEFLAGIALGCFFLQGGASTWWRKIPGGAVGAAAFAGVAIVALCGLAGPAIPFLLLHNGLLDPLIALLVLALASLEGRPAAWAGHRWLVRLGGASFSLYILHLPLLDWVRGLDDATIRLGDRAPVTMFALYLTLAVGVSLAVFTWFEEPLRKRLRPRKD